MSTSFTDNIRAYAGGGQSNATQLTSEVNRVTTVVTAGDSLKLPPSGPGQQIKVMNSASNYAQMFGYGTDTINGVAYATGIELIPNTIVTYTCYTVGSWYSQTTYMTSANASSAGNLVFLSQQPNVYINSSTDSTAGLQAAINAVQGTGQTLVIDGPIKCVQGTNWLQTIFIGPNVSILGMDTSVITYDGVGVPLFICANASNSTIRNLTFNYVGTFGVTAYVYSTGQVLTFGTLTGGSGYTNGTYSNVRLTGGTGIDCYVTIVVSGGAVTSVTLQGSIWGGANYQVGNTLSCSNTYIGGTGSGFSVVVGTVNTTANSFSTAYNNCANITIQNYYSALYTSSGGTAGNSFGSGSSPNFAGATNACATVMIRGQTNNFSMKSCTFQVPANAPACNFIPVAVTLMQDWIPGQAITSSTSQNSTTRAVPTDCDFSDITLDGYLMGFVGQGVNNRFVSIRGKRYSDLQNTAANDPNNNMVGGVGYWFAPPHLFYIGADSIYNSNCFVYTIIDEGTYVGNPVRRSTGSGLLTSCKIAPQFGTTINDYTSLRAEGGIQVTSTVSPTSDSDGAITNLFIQFNSNTTVLTKPGDPVGASTGIVFPSSSPLYSVYLQGKCIDTATVPSGFPVGSDSTSGHSDTTVDFDIVTQDYPATNYTVTTYAGTTNTTNYYQGTPGMGFGGSGNTVNLRVTFSNFTNTTYGYRPVVANYSTPGPSNSNWNVQIVGWRAITASNIDVQKAKIIIAGTLGVFSNNFLRQYDVSNQMISEVSNGLILERWTQGGVFVPPAGSSFTTSIMFPNTFSITKLGYVIAATAFNGPTSLSLGDSASATRFLSNGQPYATIDPQLPMTSPIALVNSPTTVVLTANGGSIASTASITASINGTTLTVTAVASGTLASGTGLIGTSVLTSTVIISQLTGTTGGVGTYLINNTQNIASAESMTGYAAIYIALEGQRSTISV